MALSLPSAVPSMGTRRVVFIPGPRPATLTAAAVNAADNISCYLTRTGWQPTKDQATITDSRYCSAQDFELPGAKTRSLMLQYTFNLNEPTEDEARIALAEGAEGTLVHFVQIEEDADEFATGDWYEDVYVRMGSQDIVNVEDNAVDRINQKAFIRGEWSELKQLTSA